MRIWALRKNAADFKKKSSGCLAVKWPKWRWSMQTKKKSQTGIEFVLMLLSLACSIIHRLLGQQEHNCALAAWRDYILLAFTVYRDCLWMHQGGLIPKQRPQNAQHCLIFSGRITCFVFMLKAVVLDQDANTPADDAGRTWPSFFSVLTWMGSVNALANSTLLILPLRSTWQGSPNLYLFLNDTKGLLQLTQ